MENEEIKIGEVGTIDGVNVVCDLADGETCIHEISGSVCCFINNCGCLDRMCSDLERSDGKNVCYKLAGD